MDDPQDTYTRKRKGSLRKTVLLGVERLRDNRRSSLSAGSNNPRKSPTNHASSDEPSQALNARLAAPKRFAFELPNASTESHDPSSPRTSTNSDTAEDTDHDALNASTHDVISPTTTSTLSDDDVLTFPSLTAKTGTSTLDSQTLRPTLLPPPITSVSPSPSPPSSESSGPAFHMPMDGSVRRRRSTLLPGKSSPLISTPTIGTLPPIEEEWDYSETERWGWTILIVTWVVFVVGMGSCMGVWSWAWDVGETPYAPPELEDDPTLPIVGYYPALLVLTAVMSWVWVVVAWVGLKYFKHAKMGVVEDG